MSVSYLWPAPMASQPLQQAGIKHHTTFLALSSPIQQGQQHSSAPRTFGARGGLPAGSCHSAQAGSLAWSSPFLTGGRNWWGWWGRQPPGSVGRCDGERCPLRDGWRLGGASPCAAHFGGRRGSFSFGWAGRGLRRVALTFRLVTGQYGLYLVFKVSLQT